MNFLSRTAMARRDVFVTRHVRIAQFVCLAMAAAWGGAAPQTAWGQGADSKQIQPPQEVKFSTKDRLDLAGTYYASNVGREAPVVVFLHGEGGNRLGWTKSIAPSLQTAGYAVITVDLRGHGQSKVDTPDNRNRRRSLKLIPQDYKNMVELDMEAIKSFILDEHQAGNLNMNKTGLVGAEMGAAVAVWYALLDWQKPPHPDGIGANRTPRGQDVRALVLLSPTNVPGLPYAKPITELRNPAWDIHLLVAAGRDKKDMVRQAERIFELFTKLSKNNNGNYLQIYPGELQGMDLLSANELRVADHIATFFDQSLKSLPPSWRDRKSKIAAE